MKKLYVLLVTILIGTANAPVEGARAPKPSQSDYDLGVAVGHCVAVQCEIFQGLVLTASPKSGEAITVRREETILGVKQVSEIQSLPYENFDHVRNGDNGGGLALAWENAAITENRRIIVVLALEDGFGVRKGEPVFVTTADHDADIIRSLAIEAIHFRRSPESIEAAANALSHTPNPSLAGFLFALLSVGDLPLPREARVTSLAVLLGGKSVPSSAALPITGFMTIHYPSLSPDLQSLMMNRFSELAQGPDLDISSAAFFALSNVLSFDRSALSFLSPTMLKGLDLSYRKMVSGERLKRSSLIEEAIHSRAILH